MRKNWKKVLSLVLALAMVLSMDTTAVAAGEIVAAAEAAVPSPDVNDNTSDAELPAAADNRDVDEAAGELNDGWKNCGGWSVSFNGKAFNTVAKYDPEEHLICVSGNVNNGTLNISANDVESLVPITVSAANLGGIDWNNGSLSITLSANGNKKGAWMQANTSDPVYRWTFKGEKGEESVDYTTMVDDGDILARIYPLTKYPVSDNTFAAGAKREPYNEKHATFTGYQEMWVDGSSDITKVAPIDDKGTFNVTLSTNKVVFMDDGQGNLAWAKTPGMVDKSFQKGEFGAVPKSMPNILSVNYPKPNYEYALVAKNEFVGEESNPISGNIASMDGNGKVLFNLDEMHLPVGNGYYLASRMVSDNELLYPTPWYVNGSAGHAWMNPPAGTAVRLVEKKARNFTISPNTEDTTNLKAVVVEKDSIEGMVLDEASWNEVIASFKPVNGAVKYCIYYDKAEGNWKGGEIEIQPATQYEVYAAYISGGEFLSGITKITGLDGTGKDYVETLPVGKVTISLNLTDKDIKYTAESLSWNLFPRTRVTVVESRGGSTTDITDQVKDRIEYRYSTVSDNLDYIDSSGNIDPAADTYDQHPAGKYYLAAYLGVDHEEYEGFTVSSPYVEFNVVSGDALVYPLVKEAAPFTKVGDEFHVDAGAEISANAFGFEIKEKLLANAEETIVEGPSIVGDFAYVLEQGGTKKVLYIGSSDTVSFDKAGTVKITISQGSAHISYEDYNFVGKEKAAAFRVVKPDYAISVSVGSVPFGYTSEMKDDFEDKMIRNFVKVIDKNDGNRDVTAEPTTKFKVTASSNAGVPDWTKSWADSSAKAKVGDKIYVKAYYEGKDTVSAQLTEGLALVQQKVTVNPYYDYSVDPFGSGYPLFTVSAGDVVSPNRYDVSLDDGLGGTTAPVICKTGTANDYVSGGNLTLAELPTDRAEHNRLSALDKGIRLAVTGVQNTAKKPADAYAVAFGKVNYNLIPTVQMHIDQTFEGRTLKKDTEDRIRVYGTGEAVSDNQMVFTGLSKNDVIALLGEDAFNNNEIKKYISVEWQYDADQSNRSESVEQEGFSWNAEDELVLGVTSEKAQYTRDIFITIRCHVQKYDPNDTANLTMDPIGDVTYDGFKHVAEDAGNSKSQTADLAVSVHSNGRHLVYGRDYKLSYKNNVNACEDYTKVDAKKMPTVIVTGIGSYKGMEYTAYFNIKKADVSSIYQAGGLKAYYKANSKGAFTIKPKFVTGNGSYQKAVNITKEHITFRAVSANVENPLKANAVVADGTKGKGKLPGDQAMKLALIVKVSGGVNFKDGEYVLYHAAGDIDQGGMFYVLPAKGGAVTAKFKDKKQASIDWSATKTTVSVADFVGKDLANLKITTKAKNVTVSAADFEEVPTFGCFKDDKSNIDLTSTDQVGVYEIYLRPTDKAVLEKNIAPDTVKVKVTFKAKEKLSSLKKDFKMSSYRTTKDGVSWDEATYNKAGITLPDPAYGAQVSINTPKSLKNDVTAYLMWAKSSQLCVDKKTVLSKNGLEGWLNGGNDETAPGFWNNAAGTYRIIILGQGAYSVKDKVVLTYKVVPFKADAVRIRVLSANYGTDEAPVYKKGEIFFNKGGYVFECDYQGKPYNTDVFGHVNMVFQTRDKDGNFVDNDALTQYLSISKVKITTDKSGAVKVAVTGIKNDDGKAVVKGAVKSLAEQMTAKASLSNNKSIVVVNKGLTTDKVSKPEKSIVLEQYSAAKGIDAEGNYKTVKLTKNEYSMTGFFAQGLSGNNAAFTGTGSFSGSKTVSGNDDLLTYLEKYGVAVGKDNITKGFNFNAATITGTAKSLTYKNGLRVMPEKLTIKGKGKQTDIVVDTASANSAEGQYNKDLGVRIFVKFANNRDISSKAQATIYFVPVDASAQYIGSKTVKFKITK